MNPEKPPPPRDAPEEVSALIETLHETGRRLEELTGGEVDAVADREGRTFLLRRAQDRLRHNEAAKQAAILNALPAHVALLDTQGIIISVNEAWRQFAGATVIQCPGHATGVNYLEICDSEGADDSSEAQQVCAGIRAVLGGGVKSFSLEYSCHSRTQQRWFVMTVTPLADDPPNGAVVMHVDVTAERQAEESLRASESRFRQIADNIREVFFLVDAETNRTLYLSPAFEGIWGLSCESVYADTEAWIDAIHPEDRAGTYESYKKGMSSGRFDYQYRIIRPDGSIRWIEARGFPVRDDEGRIFRIAGVAEDITERKQAADELRRSESLKGAILESSLDCIITIDHGGKIVEFNPAAETTFGLPREQALGKAMVELIVPPRLRDAHSRGFAHYLATGDGPILGKRLELEAIRRDGSEFPIELAVVPIGSGSTPMFTGFIRDITTRKEAEAKIKRLNRVYAVLSGINALIVRVRNRTELFREACRIAVEAGQFPEASISVVDPKTLEVTAAAWAGGGDQFFASVRYYAGADAPPGGSPGVDVIQSQRPWVCNDIATEGGRLLYREEYRAHGFCSAAILPLVVDGKSVGLLLLFAAELGFFDDQEMKLLNELAGDISFALDHLEKTTQLDYLAYYDALTGLANRNLFLQRLEQQLIAARNAQHKQAVFILDIERFKTINEAYGRQAGDALLKQVADRLVQVGGDASRFARIGADHFAIVAADVENEEQVGRYTEPRLNACFGPPYQVAGQEVRISAKVGIAMFPTDGTDADALLRNAEAALKNAKASGDRYLFYTQSMNERVAEKFSLENKLRQAIEKEQFVLYYQPKVDLDTRAVVGVEALIRWQSPDKGLVPPLDFIPLLEETGLILQVGAWALRRAARDHRSWVEQNLIAPRVAVNVSAIQLRQRDFVGVVEQAIIDGVAPTAIDLEITESLVMADIKGNSEKLKAVRALGVNIAIDDFGTGYSSLGYLAQLPVQSLKIDRSFIITMQDDSNAMTLVSTIISLAHSLRLKVIAEGVETEQQAKLLRLLRCDEMQGYLFSKPLPVEALVELLRKRS